jgi:hypothetical protein
MMAKRGTLTFLTMKRSQLAITEQRVYARSRVGRFDRARVLRRTQSTGSTR